MERIEQLLTLCAVPGFGPARINKILAFLSLEQFFSLPDSALLSMGIKQEQIARLRHPDRQAIERVLVWQQAEDSHLVTLFDDDYPPQLRAIADPPPLFYLCGQREVLQQPQLAIVGSRHATPVGLQNSYHFGRELAAMGLAITSGLAIGVDGRAHQGALDGDGKTVAVMATGIDRIYPKRHQALAMQIRQQGALISENPLGSAPFAAAFPRRNRLISGLSLGTLVVEATAKSGSLITARMALEQGREVFAVPGTIANPLADGCNGLIQQGAKLVMSAADIVEELVIPVNCSKKQQSSQIREIETELALPLARLLDSVDYEPTSVDEVVLRGNLPIAQVMAGMIELELAGYVLSVPGGYVRLRRGS